MNPSREHALLLTRRQFFGRTAAGIGTAALASMMNPSLFASPSPGLVAPSHGTMGNVAILPPGCNT